MDAVLFGDCRENLRMLAALGVRAQCCVTSPPYFGLRSYLPDEHPDKPLEIGLEESPDEYIARMVDVFRAVWDVLADDGTLWLNIGDSYARNPSKGGSGPHGKNGAYSDTYTNAGKVRQFKPQAARRQHGAGVGNRAPQPDTRASGDGIKEKDLIGIPWMLAFALRADGWYLRQEVIWAKPNPMPESVRDRPTRAHEQIFLLSKSPRYFYDIDAIAEPAACAQSGRPSRRRGDFDGKGQPEGRESFRAVVEKRNKRSVWTIAPRPYAGAHFATFPPDLVEPCILAGTPPRWDRARPVHGQRHDGPSGKAPRPAVPWLRAQRSQPAVDRGAAR
jgi:DNA modification methylase